MTDAERIARLEARQDATDQSLAEIKQTLTDIRYDLSTVVRALNFGKGAWLALVLVGGIVGWCVNLFVGRHG